MYYICVVLDLYARKVIAYKISRHNSTQLTKTVVKMAYEKDILPKNYFFTATKEATTHLMSSENT